MTRISSRLVRPLSAPAELRASSGPSPSTWVELGAAAGELLERGLGAAAGGAAAGVEVDAGERASALASYVVPRPLIAARVAGDHDGLSWAG